MNLYVDMDGVLTDFDQQAADLFDVPREEAQEYMEKHPKKAWFKIDHAGVEFWSEMPWMPDGKELWQNVAIRRPTILSSPSKHRTSVIGKKQWIGENLGDVPILLDSNKARYVHDKCCVLIDDREKNIQAWEKAGGTGILHKNTRETIEKLEDFFISGKYANDYSNRGTTMQWLSNTLDKIATSLENKGLIQEAERIDVLANTVDRLAGEKPKGEKGDAKERSRPNPVFDHTDPKVLDNADHFPINTEKRARAALSYANHYHESPGWYDGSLEELKKKVADAVKKAYPDIEVSEESYK
jgi:FMN phosphatase YigB (HAD superfamily)